MSHVAALAALVAMLADGAPTRPPCEPVLRIRETTARWQGGHRVPRHLRDGWNRPSGRIRRHEERHRENVIQAARSMRDEIAGLPFHARCDQADAAMKRVVDSAEMKRRFADQFVDQRRMLPLSRQNGN